MCMDMCMDLCVDMCVDMCMDMHWACAACRWKALAKAVMMSTGTSACCPYPCTGHAIGDANIEPMKWCEKHEGRVCIGKANDV